MLRKSFSLLFGLLLVVGLSAQYSASDSKAIEKSKALFKKAKYDKAITTLAKVQPNYVFDNELWELRVIYEYIRYKTQFQKDINTLVKKAGSGKTISVKFKSMEYRSQMLNQCKLATMLCERQGTAHGILFDEMVAESVDTTVSDEAKEAHGAGDNEYNQENWSAAIKQYQKSLREDSTYYDATLSIGMCYGKQEEWEKAIPWYKKAIRLRPDRLKAHINLVECYTKLKRWDEAYAACVEGIICYPSDELFGSLSEVCEKKGKSFNRHWMFRLNLPNRMNTDQDAATKDPWSFYRSAKGKIEDNCDDKGIIKSSELTSQKYMETYSWEYMLKKDDTDEKEFGFARRMQTEGYLDCYVFVSMYHVNFREQYIDFSKNNAERIRTYIDTQLVK